MTTTKDSKIAVFPGSFDPITIGHESVILRSLSIFDKIIVAVGVNSTKQNMFTVEERINFIKETFADQPKVEVLQYSGLTVNFCEQHQAKYILRGLRTSADFEFERSIGQVNKMMNKEIETLFLLTSTNHTPITSSVVRDIIRNSGDLSKLIPSSIVHFFK